jgi:RNA polymerase sigma-70 factor (ECF subfamily)
VRARKALESKQSSVSAAFAEHYLFLKKFVARYFSSQHDIEDVVQEAYLRAYAAESTREIDAPKAYLFRIAKNVALSELTKKSRQITDYLEEASASAVIDTAPAADLEVAAQELLGLYCQAIATLSEKCREVFLLRKVYGLSHKEIATRTSLSVSSVEKYLRQGTLVCDAYVSKHEKPPAPKEIGDAR